MDDGQAVEVQEHLPETIRGWMGAAKYIGRSDKWVRDVYEAGKLPGEKGEDGVYVFRREDLDLVRQQAANNPHPMVPPLKPSVVTVQDVVQPTPQPTTQATQAYTSLPPPQVIRVAPHAPPAPTPVPHPKKGAPQGPLSGFLGNAERMKVYKRNELNGAREYIRAYGWNDVKRSQDIETFVQQYLVPTYGEGEYETEVWDSEKCLKTQPVFVRNPAGAAKAVTGSDVATDRLAGLVETLIKAQQAQAQAPQPGIQDKLGELRALQEMMGGGQSALPVMMMMLQQQRPAGPDPVVMQILSTLQAEVRHLREQAAAPVMMPPPTPLPPPEPTIDIVKVLEATKPAVPPMTIDGVINAIKALRPEEKKDSLGIKDMIALLPTIGGLLEKFSGKEELGALLGELADMRKDSHKSSLRDRLEDLRALQEVARTGTFPEQDSFVGFLRELASDFPEKLKALSALADKFKGAPQAQLPAGNGKRRVAPEAVPEPPKEPAPPDAGGFSMPEGLPEAVAKMGQAKTDAQRVNTTLAAFRTLVAHPNWASWGPEILRLAKAGEKGELLRLVAELLDGLSMVPALGQLLPAQARKAIKGAFDKNIVTVIGLIKGEAPKPKKPAAPAKK